MTNSKHNNFTYRMATVQGDTHTPVSLFKKLKGKKKFLLESSKKHAANGRYSYLGVNPSSEIKSFGTKILYKDLKTGEIAVHAGRIIDFLKREIQGPQIESIPFPFYGGAIGFFSYDVIRQYEEIGEVPKDEIAMPDSHFMVCSELFVFDHISQTIHLIALGDETAEILEGKLSSMKQMLNEESTGTVDEAPVLDFQPTVSKQEFMQRVETIKESIIKGDIFQAVLSQRFISDIEGDPFEIYRKLRIANPSPYMYYLDFEDYQVVGSSPESMVRGVGRDVYLNPIAGTMPRGKTDEEDAIFEQTLLADEKERAEHMMLVDLGRNDLGRVSKIGSIRITSSMIVERYQFVMHLVSEIAGTLRDDLSPLDALAVSLPAGTVSGAPKIESMKLINRLEQKKRGLYSGAVGYVGFNGNLDMALAIRTMIVKDDKAYIQAGAGIVYDSKPEKEYQETLNKAKSLMGALKNDFVNR
ncbi:anthranilate synthase component I [Peribacillus sp. SCS-155]|uniref:anthranilate synthase component I n=1 Tax=Peribacillus sedimenti TaxID=3115297 RepID=UPI0039058866